MTEQADWPVCAVSSAGLEMAVAQLGQGELIPISLSNAAAPRKGLLRSVPKDVVQNRADLEVG